MYTFILGAADPEMTMMEKIIKVHGVHTIAHALNAEGKPVRPHEAYQAVKTDSPVEGDPVFVECQVEGIAPTIVLDHHRPGDPGYGIQPKDYQKGSSLGQLLMLLDLDVEVAAELIGVNATDILCCMAADHCLSAAYQGECPGVDPKVLSEWRARTRAEYQGIDPKDILEKVNMAKRLLLHMPTVRIGEYDVKDVRQYGTIDELPEASAQLGVPVLYKMYVRGKGTKVGLLGAPKDLVTVFMEDWAHDNGLVDVYGSPDRGYAGAWESKLTNRWPK